MNLLKRIFGKKNSEAKDSKKLPKIGDVLSKSQEDKAREFYQKHKVNIDNLVKRTEKAYEPSQTEDKNNPMIWKTEYWKWFLNA